MAPPSASPPSSSTVSLFLSSLNCQCCLFSKNSAISRGRCSKEKRNNFRELLLSAFW
uniref:Uncharacterized protein n=1 Tax=Anopheles christyi TaxID=43041 RepID=A0A182KHX4_9DIPT